MKAFSLILTEFFSTNPRILLEKLKIGLSFLLLKSLFTFISNSICNKFEKTDSYPKDSEEK